MVMRQYIVGVEPENPPDDYVRPRGTIVLLRADTFRQEVFRTQNQFVPFPSANAVTFFVTSRAELQL